MLAKCRTNRLKKCRPDGKIGKFERAQRTCICKVKRKLWMSLRVKERANIYIYICVYIFASREVEGEMKMH